MRNLFLSVFGLLVLFFLGLPILIKSNSAALARDGAYNGALAPHPNVSWVATVADDNSTTDDQGDSGSVDDNNTSNSTDDDSGTVDTPSDSTGDQSYWSHKNAPSRKNPEYRSFGFGGPPGLNYRTEI